MLTLTSAQSTQVRIERARIEKLASTTTSELALAALRLQWKGVPAAVARGDFSFAKPATVATTTPLAPIECGPYRTNGNVYMVKPSRKGNYNLAYRVTENGHEYQGAAARFVKAEDRITDPAEASALGESHGFCICCARLLTAVESVYRGVGPICLKNYF